MREALLTVPPEDAGSRLDAWLAGQDAGLTRSAIQQLLTQGHILRNGSPAKKNDRLHGGDRIAVSVPEAEPAEAEPEDIPLDIVYEDAELIVVNKPRGMVVHPAPGHPAGTLVNALLFHCAGQLSTGTGVARPGIVHRIDRDTSGLLIAAKTDRAHAGLARQIAEHSFLREYEAVICGRLREPEGTVHAPVGRDPNDRKKMCITARGGKDAVTHYRTVAAFAHHTHICCRLETGRTHQIRVHMRSIGHPIYGDPVYGRAAREIAGQCLHARKIGFLHPLTGEMLCFDSPLPEDFERVLRKVERET